MKECCSDESWSIDPYVAIRVACVSGRAVSDWADDDLRSVYLQPVGGPSRIAVAGPMRLKDALDHHKMKVERILARDKKITYRSTVWYQVDETSTSLCYGKKDEHKVVKLNNTYIFSAKKNL